MVGRTVRDRTGGFGFSAASPSAPGEAVLAPIDGHAIGLAPTGAGKLLSLVVPWVLSWPAEGSVVVVDPKGEAACVTASSRARRGSAVHVVDPFGVSGPGSSTCNPLGFLNPKGEDLVDDAKAVAETMLPQRFDDRDVFWRNRALNMVSLAIVHVMRDFPRHRRTLVSVRDVLHKWGRLVRRGTTEQFPGAASAALKLDTSDPEVLRVAEVLDIGSSDTVGGIVHYALEAVGFMQGVSVERSLGFGGIDFDAFAEGAPCRFTWSFHRIFSSPIARCCGCGRGPSSPPSSEGPDR